MEPPTARPGQAVAAWQHTALAHPTHALAVARRPGEFLLRFDIHTARAVPWFEIEDDHVSRGYAAFALDGSALYTTQSGAPASCGPDWPAWLVPDSKNRSHGDCLFH